MDLPNYDEQPDSPVPSGPGVTFKLEKESYAASEPVVLRGAYELDPPLIEKVGDDALYWTQLVAIRRDQPLVHAHAAQEPPQVVMSRPPIKAAPGTKIGGWFNVELRAHLGLGPGTYWLAAFLVNHRTEWVSLELRAE